jgi:hypothetical protein
MGISPSVTTPGICQILTGNSFILDAEIDFDKNSYGFLGFSFNNPRDIFPVEYPHVPIHFAIK